MAKKNISQTRKSAKKKIRKAIREKLTIALSDYSTLISRKRFESLIRKMSRTFTNDLLKQLPKKIQNKEPK